MSIFEKMVADIKLPTKKVKQAEVDKAVRKINEQGFKIPIVIDVDSNVISGQDRLMAAIELKMGSVPVIVAEEVKPKRSKTKKEAGGK